MDTFTACFVTALLSVLILSVSITADVVKRVERRERPYFSTKDAGVWFGVLCSLVVSVVMFFAVAPNEFRDETVKAYIDGNIVKEVKYKTTNTDGVVTQKDSTIHFLLKKEK